MFYCGGGKLRKKKNILSPVNILSDNNHKMVILLTFTHISIGNAVCLVEYMSCYHITIFKIWKLKLTNREFGCE